MYGQGRNRDVEVENKQVGMRREGWDDCKMRFLIGTCSIT